MDAGTYPRKRWILIGALTAATLMALAAAPSPGAAAPSARLWPRWLISNAKSEISVDHRLWDSFLARYVVSGHPSGINLVRYGEVTFRDIIALDSYIEELQSVPVSYLNRGEQIAYWINLYNSLTVRLILEHYPLDSIKDIRRPWKRKLASIEGIPVSLDDIEHRILRPIWKDNRFHYVLNCAAKGCPNLLPVAFTARNAEAILDRAARDFVNHSPGARVEGGKIHTSTIYRWFMEDFGGSRRKVVEHLLRYAEGELRGELNRMLEKGRIRLKYHYDWSLNDVDKR